MIITVCLQTRAMRKAVVAEAVSAGFSRAAALAAVASAAGPDTAFAAMLAGGAPHGEQLDLSDDEGNDDEARDETFDEAYPKDNHMFEVCNSATGATPPAAAGPDRRGAPASARAPVAAPVAAPSGARLTVGDRCVLAPGARTDGTRLRAGVVGTITRDDHDSSPYRVDDNSDHWYRENELMRAPPPEDPTKKKKKEKAEGGLVLGNTVPAHPLADDIAKRLQARFLRALAVEDARSAFAVALAGSASPPVGLLGSKAFFGFLRLAKQRPPPLPRSLEAKGDTALGLALKALGAAVSDQADPPAAAALSRACAGELLYHALYVPPAAAGGCGGRSKTKCLMDTPLAWDPTTVYNASSTNITFREDNTVASFNSNTDHRCVFGSIAVGPGQVGQWKVTIMKRPCCGYTGVCEGGAKRGKQNVWADQSTCVGFSNCSAERNVGKEVGTSVIIRLDLRGSGTITYITKHGERECPISPLEPLYPAVDSDENGDYKIEWDGPKLGVVKAKGGGGSAELAWRAPPTAEEKALRSPCPALALDIAKAFLGPAVCKEAAAEVFRQEVLTALIKCAQGGEGDERLESIRSISLFLDGANRHGLPASGRFDLSSLGRLGREMAWMHGKEKAAGKGFSSYLMALVQVMASVAKAALKQAPADVAGAVVGAAAVAGESGLRELPDWFHRFMACCAALPPRDEVDEVKVATKDAERGGGGGGGGGGADDGRAFPLAFARSMWMQRETSWAAWFSVGSGSGSGGAPLVAAAAPPGDEVSRDLYRLVAVTGESDGDLFGNGEWDHYRSGHSPTGAVHGRAAQSHMDLAGAVLAQRPSLPSAALSRERLTEGIGRLRDGSQLYLKCGHAVFTFAAADGALLSLKTVELGTSRWDSAQISVTLRSRADGADPDPGTSVAAQPGWTDHLGDFPFAYSSSDKKVVGTHNGSGVACTAFQVVVHVRSFNCSLHMLRLVAGEAPLGAAGAKRAAAPRRATARGGGGGGGGASDEPQPFVALDPTQVTYSTKTSSSDMRLMLEDTTNRYWESSGSCPHHLEVALGEAGWSTFEVKLNDYGSYSPKKVRVHARVDGALTVLASEPLEIPKGGNWTVVARSSPENEAATHLRFEVVSNWDGGCDTKVASVRVRSRPPPAVAPCPGAEEAECAADGDWLAVDFKASIELEALRLFNHAGGAAALAPAFAAATSVAGLAGPWVPMAGGGAGLTVEGVAAAAAAGAAAADHLGKVRISGAAPGSWTHKFLGTYVEVEGALEHGHKLYRCANPGATEYFLFRSGASGKWGVSSSVETLRENLGVGFRCSDESEEPTVAAMEEKDPGSSGSQWAPAAGVTLAFTPPRLTSPEGGETVVVSGLAGTARFWRFRLGASAASDALDRLEFLGSGEPTLHNGGCAAFLGLATDGDVTFGPLLSANATSKAAAGADPSLNGAGGLTLECWAMASDAGVLASAEEAPLGAWPELLCLHNDWALKLRRDLATAQLALTFDAPGNATASALFAAALPTGRFTHVAVVLAKGQALLYLNGSLADTVDDPSASEGGGGGGGGGGGVPAPRSCGACTFLCEDPDATACSICETALPKALMDLGKGVAGAVLSVLPTSQSGGSLELAGVMGGVGAGFAGFVKEVRVWGSARSAKAVDGFRFFRCVAGTSREASSFATRHGADRFLRLALPLDMPATLLDAGVPASASSGVRWGAPGGDLTVADARALKAATDAAAAEAEGGMMVAPPTLSCDTASLAAPLRLHALTDAAAELAAQFGPQGFDTFWATLSRVPAGFDEELVQIVSGLREACCGDMSAHVPWGCLSGHFSFERSASRS